MWRLLTACLASVGLLINSCVSEPVQVRESVSLGATHRGYLRRPVRLTNRGLGYVRTRPRDDTRYGTRTLIGAIQRAAQSVHAAFPGGHPLKIGDLSSRLGGPHPRHASHQSGRDADLLFYVRDLGGLSVEGPSWLPIDRYGLGMHPRQAVVFDTARNWHLVRTLLLDEQARVKWLFVSKSVKARLLRYAARRETSPRALARATWVLHEPRRGRVHDDHFHLRVGCAPEEAQLGCHEQPPFWPWLTDRARKLHHAPIAAADDAQLLHWLFADQHVNEGRYVTRRGFDSAPEPSPVAFGEADHLPMVLVGRTP